MQQTSGYAMPKQAKQFDELYHDTLKDIYFAEKKIMAALPRMAKAAKNAELRKVFEKHLTGDSSRTGVW